MRACESAAKNVRGQGRGRGRGWHQRLGPEPGTGPGSFFGALEKGLLYKGLPGIFNARL